MKTINSFRSKLFALTLAITASVASFAYDDTLAMSARVRARSLLRRELIVFISLLFTRLYIWVSYGVPIVIYRVSNVYLSYMYRISTVIDSGEIADFCCKGTAFPKTLQ